MNYTENRKEITRFLNEHYNQGIGCEVGVLRGEFSEHLLNNWNCKKLYLVDCWEEHSNDYDETFHDHDSNFSIMSKRLQHLKDRIEICRGYSDKVVENFQDNMFDFIYIDANHSYEGCTKDLELYWPKLKEGGILMGDDYHLKDIETLNFNNNIVTFGVTKAVQEFTKTKGKIFDIHYTADWIYSNGLPARNFVIQK